MLGEGYCTVLKYKWDSGNPPPETEHHSVTEDPPAETSSTSLSPRPSLSPPILAGRQGGQDSLRTHLTTTSNEDGGLELYRSCCSLSLCEDYSDLQLGGDQLGERRSHWESQIGDGPLLQSEDLEQMQMQGLAESHEQGRSLKEWAEPLPMQDKEYMVMDNSILGLSRERLSNSMINGYLETKLLEVYSQHMQDNLARLGSTVEPELVPALMPASLVALSGKRSDQDSRLDSTQGSVRYLSNCSAPENSIFSSPVLRISQAESEKASQTK
ncbi:uncharacterized protein CXorf21 [Denticeps clupeoides]|uniref:uncharacterized protein CXorf21 n=1 Tax=Denticeps clupeoides TaxID=299321 RepID=UPI0010A43F60|nr:uncharacterized protein CXorf21-like [Denticeps clupeoides]